MVSGGTERVGVRLAEFLAMHTVVVRELVRASLVDDTRPASVGKLS